jgi:hypothetical protein
MLLVCLALGMEPGSILEPGSIFCQYHAKIIARTDVKVMLAMNCLESSYNTADMGCKHRKICPVLEIFADPK